MATRGLRQRREMVEVSGRVGKAVHFPRRQLLLSRRVAVRPGALQGPSRNTPGRVLSNP